jgi:hypothetical protein
MMKMPETEHQHDVVVVVSQELPSAVEVTSLPEDNRIEEAPVGSFGSRGAFDPKYVRKALLDLEKHVEKLQEVPSEYPPETSPILYAKLDARFLARISARRYRENNKLKTYAFDVGVMGGEMYLFLVVEKVDLDIKRRAIKVAPLSSVKKAPEEWLEGINPDLIRSFLPEDVTL